MRLSVAALAAFIVCADVAPVIAASDSHSFTVGATVVASCSIIPQRIFPRLELADGPVSMPCSQAIASSITPAPRAVVRFIRDATTGLATLMFEF